MKIRVKPFAPFLMAWLLTGLLWAQSVPLNEGARKYLEKELQPQLYNLENDISETDNLIEEYPQIHENLQVTHNNIRELGSECEYTRK